MTANEIVYGTSVATSPGCGEGERLARAGLTRLAEPGDRELVSNVNAYGAEQVLAAIVDGSYESTRLEDYRVRLPELDPVRDLERCARRGGRFLCPGDPEWPAQVEEVYPPPVGLWVRGSRDLADMTQQAITVVGARGASPHGRRVAEDLAAEVAERGWTVVSGAARGIDGAAHRGALAVGGTTVAVLACGVDVIYPRGHEDLLDQIAAAGLIISEVPSGFPPLAFRFLQRNRVLAGLSRGTVVVEAGVRSGALNTARWAIEANRIVMACPGQTTAQTSAGCHELIRNRQAELVVDAHDVVELVGRVGEDLAPARRGAVTLRDRLSQPQQRVLDAVRARSGEPVVIIARTAGLNATTTLAALDFLAAAGLVDPVADGWRLTSP